MDLEFLLYLSIHEPDCPGGEVDYRHAGLKPQSTWKNALGTASKAGNWTKHELDYFYLHTPQVAFTIISMFTNIFQASL